LQHQTKQYFPKTLKLFQGMQEVVSMKAKPATVGVPSASSGLSFLRAGRDDVLLVKNAAAIDLEPEPIPRDWILSGTPVASAKMLLRTRDWASSIVVWECTAGRFNWHYNKDEILFIVSGQATLTNDRGEEREFGPGEVVFFPAGVSCTWHVKDRIRKVAILRETLWRPLGMCVKAWAKLLRTVGVGSKSPL
jgi:uncharacterized cupin superfamily protein